MKKILLCIAAALYALSALSAAAYADSAGFAVESGIAFPVKAPYDKNYVEILWSTPEAETVGIPVTDGEFVLIPTLNKINKLSEKDGKLEAFAELGEKVSETCRGAVLNGVLVQPARSSVYVINTADMSVKCSAVFGETVTDVALIDSLAYFGVKTGEAYKFICADVSDGLKTVWEFECSSPPTSPALSGDFVIFGNGFDLIVHERQSENYVENPVGAEISAVFAGKYAVFMSGADGVLYKLRLTEDGSAEPDTLTGCTLGGTLTAPAELNNRVYVGSSEGFFVLDGLNMDVLRHFPEMKNASAPFICYGNGQRAYTAAPHGGDGWYLYGILDTEDGQTASEIAKIHDYTGGSYAVSAEGTLYFRDAAGQVWAVAERENDLFTIILKAVLMLSIVVMAVLIIRAWSKKRAEKRPPQY